MRDIMRAINQQVKKITNARNKIKGDLIFTIIILVSFVAMLAILSGSEQGYSPVTKKCISCHNDTGYPNDTNLDGVAAPYKRPHNNTVMCESCHGTNPHFLTYIQPNGTYGTRLIAASCPDCHQVGIPAANNANFTSAPMIPNPLHHSSNISNGSVWGSYWAGTDPKTACIYCHNKTLHNTTPLGRILEWSPNYITNDSIGNNFSCSGCHYKGDDNWSVMNSTFASAGLQTPPEITNGTNWNGIYSNYFNHTLNNYSNEMCSHCHGSLLSANASMKEFMHNVAVADLNSCMDCHNRQQGIYPAIDAASFGKHKNVDKTDGNNTLTNNDCQTCHYNITDMLQPGFTTPTFACIDCHILGNYSAPVISNHRPPSLPISQGGSITTGAYCTICHINSINAYVYSDNASVSHYGTNSSLIKPTVNQTSMPRFGFMTQADASAYNKECTNCHYPSNPNYGNATLIFVAHTSLGTCNECHVNVSAYDLHNSSLGMPQTFSCIGCHTTFASKYRAPNLTGTSMTSFTNCEGCHGGGNGNQLLDTLFEHNINRYQNGYTPAGPGLTDAVYLNGQTSLAVTTGTIVTVTSRVNDTPGLASRVGGAEYYVDTDPGIGRGIPMDPTDGQYDAVNGIWENVNATVDTSNLSLGTHTVYVRGMDIGKQWSAVKSATLTVQPPSGYINGTVTSGGLAVPGALLSTTNASDTTKPDGTYSLRVPSGTYNVTASKQPEYYDNTVTGVVVTPLNTTPVYIVITGKPTGTLSGVVTSI